MRSSFKWKWEIFSAICWSGIKVKASYLWSFFSLFLKDISPFCGVTDSPVLNFWWHLLWVSEWAALFTFYGSIFTSGVTPTDLLAAKPISPTYLQACIGGAQNWDLSCCWRMLCWLSYAHSAHTYELHKASNVALCTNILMHPSNRHNANIYLNWIVCNGWIGLVPGVVAVWEHLNLVTSIPGNKNTIV